MKLYKFRSLNNLLDCDRDTNLKRAIDILETGEFWCSSFWNLNDPMEGVYETIEEREFINEVYSKKSKLKICSFSGECGFYNPVLWGYYSNGFKGIAIELEVLEVKVREINYVKELKLFNDTSKSKEDIAKDILSQKFDCWEHEIEYRFFSDSCKAKIGNITAVYYGDPYYKIDSGYNSVHDKSMKEYRKKLEKLKKVAKDLNIKIERAFLKNNKVTIGD